MINIEQVLTDITAVAFTIGAISTLLAHAPFMPAKAAEFFARLSLYAANWKFSVNQRDTLPKPEDQKPAPKAPFLPMIMFALAWGAIVVMLAGLGGCRETLPPKPPCDPTTLGIITGECSARAFECGKNGTPKAECAAITECKARLDARAEECRK